MCEQIRTYENVFGRLCPCNPLTPLMSTHNDSIGQAIYNMRLNSKASEAFYSSDFLMLEDF